jgi:hypothetical protein
MNDTLMHYTGGTQGAWEQVRGKTSAGLIGCIDVQGTWTQNAVYVEHTDTLYGQSIPVPRNSNSNMQFDITSTGPTDVFLVTWSYRVYHGPQFVDQQGDTIAQGWPHTAHLRSSSLVINKKSNGDYVRFYQGDSVGEKTNNGLLNGFAPSSSAIVTNLAAGQYTVTVHDYMEYGTALGYTKRLFCWNRHLAVYKLA